MTDVRLTLSVLKQLRKGDKLPPQVLALYKSAESAVESSVKLYLLAQAIDIACQEVALLKDAQSRFSSGLPDYHRATTQKVGRPIYEVRDTESPAWRGAVVSFPDDAHAWLIHVDRHDRFHSTGPSVIDHMDKQGKLGPSLLDKRLRDVHQLNQEKQENHIAVLEALVDALNMALTQKSAAQVQMPLAPDLQSVNMILEVESIDEIEWDHQLAHEELEGLRIEIKLSTVSSETRDWLLRTCLPFLQSNTSMIEAIYRKDLTVQVLVTRARLIQLLASSREELPTKQADPPAPAVLHYTAKAGFTRAFFQGIAVQAVCGEWWVPIGDENTHNHLPICLNCEREEPIAQFVRDRLS